MAADLYDRIQEIRAQFPSDSRSAVMPALQLAQKEHGWLSPAAFRQVADALDLTPAFCKSVASFYDMFDLEPTGEHHVDVCTNVSCALYGAQAVLEAFEGALGCHAGETSADGKVSLSTIECLGGCGWGTIVAIDHRSRHGVKPQDVPGIVKELRG